ncbi:MAG: ribosome silencing factor [Nostocaceae cyanobacterium]|nr:ribosome silencing factor [Nostocaceae cyanobacterium]
MSDYFQGNFQLESVPLANAVNTDENSEKLSLTIAAAASDRKAGDILLLKVADVSYLADYFVIATGYSRVQVKAIADAIEDKAKTDCQRFPLRTEGKAEGTWIVEDYGDVIVHIMTPREREFYNLEAFWGHAEHIEWETSDTGGS